MDRNTLIELLQELDGDNIIFRCKDKTLYIATIAQEYFYGTDDDGNNPEFYDDSIVICLE